MDEASRGSGLGLSQRSIAVAMITVARYLASKDIGFVAYMLGSLEHAEASSLSEADLAALKLVTSAIGIA